MLNSEMQQLIDEYGNSRRDREILRLKLIDKETYEYIAELYKMSDRQIWNIVHDFKIASGILR